MAAAKESTPDGVAVVIGASGGIGAALAKALDDGKRFHHVVRLSRSGEPAFDLLDEDAIGAAAQRLSQTHRPLELIIIATGFLHNERFKPERSWRDIDAAHMQAAFTVNATGPALAMKHFLPLLAGDRRAAFACLSAKVGSIADNRLGGWHSYRASKAALNQIVHTNAIELSRAKPQAILAALHPGTVATALSAPFAKRGLNVREPAEAALNLLGVLDQLTPAQSGGFFD